MYSVGRSRSRVIPGFPFSSLFGWLSCSCISAGRLLFKGGTSLSKIFHAINRFSEDIDLAVDYVALGFTGEKDPRKEELSKTKRAVILEEMMVACREYIGGEFLGVLKERCEEILGAGGKWSLEVSKRDPNAVEFHYPPATTKSLPYIAPQVVLEFSLCAGSKRPRANSSVLSINVQVL